MAHLQSQAYKNKLIFAALPRTERGLPLILGADPKGNTFLYTNGNSVIIRNIENPTVADIYIGHSCAVNVAKYSPSGSLIASGDQSGKIRIWDATNREHILKNEYQLMDGPIKDVAWSPDNQRIVVSGHGRERFGHVFLADTGTSVGQIGGQTKPINSCDFRPIRPFRIVTGSEDFTVALFEGPPFQFKMTKREHSGFVQAVRYSPDGKYFASAGFDGKVFLYDGATAHLVGEIGDPAHEGGVYAIAWKPDCSQLLTASGDMKCRLWNVQTRKLVMEFVMGKTVDDQQVSCLWQNDHLLSVSASGYISYLNVSDPSKPLRVIKGHNKPITVMGLSEDRSTILTGSHDGVVIKWNPKNGDNDRIAGIGHGSQLNGMVAWTDSMFTCGIDDTLRHIVIDENSFTEFVIELNCQPRGVGMFRNEIILVVACINELILVEGDNKIFSLPIDYEANCIAVNSFMLQLAVGGDDQKLHIYSLRNRKLVPRRELSHLGVVTDCSFSPDNQYLVACDAHRKVVLYSVNEFKLVHNQEWGFHNARVNTVAWSPDSQMIASGSVDTAIIIWSMTDPAKHTIIRNAHPQSQITSLVWLDDKTLISAGQDCNIKVWEVEAI